MTDSERIEELDEYILTQQKMISDLRLKNEELKLKIEDLEKELNELKYDNLDLMS